MSAIIDQLGIAVDEDLAAEAAAHILQRRRRATAKIGASLSFREWLPIASPHYDWSSKHFQLIAATLERVASGEIKRLIITAPPRHGKTEIATIHFLVYLLEQHPRNKYLVGTYSADKAKEFGEDARDLADRRLPIDPDRRAAHRWRTAEGGMYRSVGRKNPPTGKGFHGAILDDPFKSTEEAYSFAIRDRAWRSFETDILQRLEPGGFAIVNSTRWHEEDVIGRILDGENAAEWTVIELPAIAEENDPAGRAPGEALWPARWPKEALEKLWRDITPSTVDTIWRCRPRKPTGNALPTQKIKRLRFEETPLWLPGDPLLRCDKCRARTYRSRLADVAGRELRHECGGTFVEAKRFRRCRAWDFATSKRHNADYSVGVLLEGPDEDGFGYWLDTVRGRWEPAERNKIMRETAERDGVDTRIRIPRDFHGNVGKEIVSGIKVALAGFTVVGIEPKGDKMRRAEPLAVTMGDGRLVLVTDAEWPEFFERSERVKAIKAAQSIAVDELTTFPTGKNDDIADALSDAHNECTRPTNSVFI